MHMSGGEYRGVGRSVGHKETTGKCAKAVQRERTPVCLSLRGESLGARIGGQGGVSEILRNDREECYICSKVRRCRCYCRRQFR